jgi:uncharacterized BrkB/YihY/UPF0761 family membrane protein
VLWALATGGLSLFIELTPSFGHTYGPLAGTLALLAWVFLSALALLYGAAIAAQLEDVRARSPRPAHEGLDRSDVPVVDVHPGILETRDAVQSR